MELNSVSIKDSAGKFYDNVQIPPQKANIKE